MPAYQENDIMAAIEYLEETARKPVSYTHLGRTETDTVRKIFIKLRIQDLGGIEEVE